MVTALVSALAGIPVRHDVAMTGEVSLRGNVLAIGGLKEKTMAAYNAGAKTVLIPHENLRDLENIDSLAKEHLKFVPCNKMADVLAEALCPVQSKEEIGSKDAVAASVYIPPHSTVQNPLHLSEQDR
jgi:ATP-dependent Lon protease